MNLEFKKRWIENFANDVEKDFIVNNVYDDCSFVWHIFSFDKISKSRYFSGIDAMKKYDQVNKKNALVYLYFDEKEVPINNKFLSANQLFKYYEVYVYPQDYSWCYIKTHECDKDNIDYLGPYFIERTM